MTKSNTWPGPLQEVAGSEDSPDISIVIVSWNTRDLLLQCLRSIQDPAVTEGVPIEVIVVDNASKDGSAEAARAITGVDVLPLRRNLGYGPANNIGLEKANGKYILILNADTILQPGCLRQMKEVADSKPRAGIVSPRLLNEDGTIQEAAFRFPTLAMAAIDLFPLPAWVPGRVRNKLATSVLNGRYTIEQLGNQPFKIDHALGACMLLRREAYQECGAFDSRIFMYSEEIDLALRYAKGGWECWQVPAARVVHLGGRSTSQAPVAMQRELWRSRLYLYDKHRSRAATLALAFLLFVAQVVALLTITIQRFLGRLTQDEAVRRRRLARSLIQVALSR